MAEGSNIRAGEATAANDDGRLPLWDKGTRIVVFGSSVQQAKKVTTSLRKQAEKSAQHLVEKVESLLPLVERVIVQARTRVLEGKQVAGSRQSARGALSLIRVSFRGTKGVHLLSLVGESNSGARGRRNCDTVPDFRASR